MDKLVLFSLAGLFSSFLHFLTSLIKMTFRTWGRARRLV